MAARRLRNRLTFLSTLSARRATDGGAFLKILADISIHALREESDLLERNLEGNNNISIHALREESDDGLQDCRVFATQFLSTLSARRATAKTEKKNSAFVVL